MTCLPFSVFGIGGDDNEDAEQEGEEEELREGEEGYSFGKLRTAKAPLMSKAARS